MKRSLIAALFVTIVLVPGAAQAVGITTGSRVKVLNVQPKSIWLIEQEVEIGNGNYYKYGTNTLIGNSAICKGQSLFLAGGRCNTRQPLRHAGHAALG